MDLMETAQLLGNFGEFLSAIAVLVTLVYLALQVKQAKEVEPPRFSRRLVSLSQAAMADSSSCS